MHKEFGDFQTPLALVTEILAYLSLYNRQWARVFEPTCGQGNFIEGILKQAVPPREIHGIEVQEMYVKQAREIYFLPSATQVTITRANIFDMNLDRDLTWSEIGPLLVIGNPPWVTNAELGAIGSSNLPRKSNVKSLSGFDARTGSANFDIAEYIWLKLINELATEETTIALLCKTSVARNVIKHASATKLPIIYASIRKIDAKKWFNAAVDACLLHVELGQGESQYQIAVYEDLKAIQPESVISVVDGQLIGNTTMYNFLTTPKNEHLVVWRQGIKHDAASVMELTYDASGKLQNKLGERVDVENEYVYPLLKSSDLFHYERARPQKAVVIPQKKLGQDTGELEHNAPQLWQYLTSHLSTFQQRKSSIYEGQSPFAIFGIGEYSFAPYKVAISGLHKMPRFRAIGPIDGKPVMLDDTCYFLPCEFPIQAAFFASLFNDPVCLEYINCIMFREAKRPITKKLLQQLLPDALFGLVDQTAFVARIRGELVQLGIPQEEIVLPTRLEDILTGYSSSMKSSRTKQNNRVSTQVSLWANV